MFVIDSMFPVFIGTELWGFYTPVQMSECADVKYVSKNWSAQPFLLQGSHV